MPYKVEERSGKFVVVNTDSGEVKAEHDTKEKADRQVRLLHTIENDPEWEKKHDD